VRLSPKSVFSALVVVGLPFAVVAGWALGAPAVGPATLGAADSLDGVHGDGGLGSAPHGAAQSRDSGYTARPPRATADPASAQPVPVTGPSTVTSTVTVVATTTPSSAQTTDPPLLTLPPVPTPTFVTDPPMPSDTPPAPSATDDPVSSSPSGYGGPFGGTRRWLWG
jgi:hypothetical protein